VGSVRVAIIGVGNCAPALVQGVEYYRQAPRRSISGSCAPRLGDYHVGGHRVLRGLRHRRGKVDLDLSEAIATAPTTPCGFAQVPRLGRAGQRGMTHDGLGHLPVPGDHEIRRHERTSPTSSARPERTWSVNFLPVGSEMATKWYVEQVLDAGCGFVNCIPVFIAREMLLAASASRTAPAGGGDDVKSQVGATIVHRILTKLFMDRGVRLDRTSQLNVGGNTDFYTCSSASASRPRRSPRPTPSAPSSSTTCPTEAIHIRPSDYIPLACRPQWAHIRMEGTGSATSHHLELKLEGVGLAQLGRGRDRTAVRACKIAMDAASRRPAGAVRIPDESPPSSGRTRRAHDRRSSSSAGGVETLDHPPSRSRSRMRVVSRFALSMTRRRPGRVDGHADFV